MVIIVYFVAVVVCGCFKKEDNSFRVEFPKLYSTALPRRAGEKMQWGCVGGGGGRGVRKKGARAGKMASEPSKGI